MQKVRNQIEAAWQQWELAQFDVATLQELKVKNAIAELRKNNMAFYADSLYLLAGVLFKKQQKYSSNLSAKLVQLMTSL